MTVWTTGIEWSSPSKSKGGSASLKMRVRLGPMPKKSPKAQTSGGEAAALSQRLEDNAFHLPISNADNSFI